MKVIQESSALGVIPFALFTGCIAGILHGKHAFDSVLLESLGLLPIYIGFLMGTSRLIWFILSRQIHTIEEKYTMDQIMILQIIIYTVGLIGVAITKNFIVALLLLAFLTGFKHALSPVNTKFIFNNYVGNKKYKATISSFKVQIENIIGMILTFSFGYTMQYSFTVGYLSAAILMCIGLIGSYYYFNKRIKKNA